MEISRENKAATLQNDALIAILIFTGREVVIWKAFVEFCRVVSLRGSGENADSEKTRLESEEKVVSGALPSLLFQTKP